MELHQKWLSYTENVKMKILITILLTLSSVTYAQVMKREANGVYIGTYNIYTFGKHGNTQVFNAAKVLSSGDFDLVAIQEVMGAKGEESVSLLTKYLKDSFNLNYSSIVSTDLGQGLGGQERIAFLYKPDVLKSVNYQGKPFQIVQVSGDGRDFAFTRWSKGNFDFVLGSGHLFYGDSKEKDSTLARRTRELKQVYSFFKDPKKQFGDEDLIFVGDFNRAALVPDFKNVSYDTTKYFIPNIEFFDPALNKIAQVKAIDIQGKGVPNDNPKCISSTVAKGNTYVYDMIICSSSLLDNYGAKRAGGKFNTNFGVISYDMIGGIGTILDATKQSSQTKLKNAYSDHRPVWVRLTIQ